MDQYLGPDLGADPSGGALFFQHLSFPHHFRINFELGSTICLPSFGDFRRPGSGKRAAARATNYSSLIRKPLS